MGGRHFPLTKTLAVSSFVALAFWVAFPHVDQAFFAWSNSIPTGNTIKCEVSKDYTWVSVFDTDKVDTLVGVLKIAQQGREIGYEALVFQTWPWADALAKSFEGFETTEVLTPHGVIEYASIPGLSRDPKDLALYGDGLVSAKIKTADKIIFLKQFRWSQYDVGSAAIIQQVSDRLPAITAAARFCSFRAEAGSVSQREIELPVQF